MCLLDEEEETQRVLISAAIVASHLHYRVVWRRYVEYTGLVDTFSMCAYLAGLIRIPVLEGDLLAHAVHELIDEQLGPSRVPDRRLMPGEAGIYRTGERDVVLDELLQQWLTPTSVQQAHPEQEP